MLVQIADVAGAFPMLRRMVGDVLRDGGGVDDADGFGFTHLNPVGEGDLRLYGVRRGIEPVGKSTRLFEARRAVDEMRNLGRHAGSSPHRRAGVMRSPRRRCGKP